MNEGMGAAYFYSKNLNKLGHVAEEIVMNDEILQRQWLKENLDNDETKVVGKGTFGFVREMARKGLSSSGKLGEGIYQLLRGTVHKVSGDSRNWMYDILVAQIEKIRPDVFFTHAVPILTEDVLKRIKPLTKLIVGQHASPIPENVPYQSYDLILSSLPNQVEFFRRKGVKSEYLRWCFEASIFDRVGSMNSKFNVSFVGGFSPNHRDGWEMFQKVADKIPVDFWGYGADTLPKDSSILKNYHGEAWGLEMYRVMAQSKITLNRHINIAENYANNMRLYEATGMGSMLLTDMKDNLHELFEVDKEVVAYRNADECVEKIRYYLEHEDERKAIARAGQERTLREHTYRHRMQEMVQIIEKYI